MKKFVTVGLGELLWDIFLEGRQLGGAPANFAYMTSLLGDDGIVASRAGDDELGTRAIQRLEQLGLSTIYIQRDTLRKTGVAQVKVDDKGQPSFEIAAPVAWDFFEWIPAWKALAEKADAVCFGSLAERSEQSRRVTHEFLRHLRPGATKIFDVNLRQSYYSREILVDAVNNADIIKLNHDELPVVMQQFGHRYEHEAAAAEWLVAEFDLKLVCVTRGARGSLLVSEREQNEHSGIPTNVADTVGAGDAFTAALIYHYLRGATLREMNEGANLMGSWVASQTGATPEKDQARIDIIRRAGA